MQYFMHICIICSLVYWNLFKTELAFVLQALKATEFFPERSESKNRGICPSAAKPWL